jgi:hypothetical protein
MSKISPLMSKPLNENQRDQPLCEWQMDALPSVRAHSSANHGSLRDNAWPFLVEALVGRCADGTSYDKFSHKRPSLEVLRSEGVFIANNRDGGVSNDTEGEFRMMFNNRLVIGRNYAYPSSYFCLGSVNGATGYHRIFGGFATRRGLTGSQT